MDRGLLILLMFLLLLLFLFISAIYYRGFGDAGEPPHTRHFLMRSQPGDAACSWHGSGPCPTCVEFFPKWVAKKTCSPEYKFDKCVFGDSFQGSRNSLAGVAGS